MSESSIVNEPGNGPPEKTTGDEPENASSEIVVTAEKWVYGGDSLARRDGEVILIPFLIPRERAQIETEPASGVRRGHVVEIVDPSPDRVEAPCPVFTACGGCHYQHAAYEKQLEWKRDIVREQLKRVGKIEFDGEIETVSGEPYGYRNRVQLHIVDGTIGFLERGTHAVVGIDHCPISSPALNQAIAALSEMLRDPRFPNFVRSIELFSNGTGTQLNVLTKDRPVAKRFFDWAEERIPGAGAGWLDYEAAGAVFRVSHNSFFQVNRFLIDALVDAALKDAEGDSALDLYAGVGLFSLSLAKRFKSVTAVESSGGSARDLEFNVERAALQVKVERQRTEQFLAELQQPPDYILADPPRAGLGKEVVRNIARLKPPKVTIVSCDPATLARDLTGLLSAGYRIEKLILADLFPQTYHLETIIHLAL